MDTFVDKLLKKKKMVIIIFSITFVTLILTGIFFQPNWNKPDYILKEGKNNIHLNQGTYTMYSYRKSETRVIQYEHSNKKEVEYVHDDILASLRDNYEISIATEDGKKIPMEKRKTQTHERKNTFQFMYVFEITSPGTYEVSLVPKHAEIDEEKDFTFGLKEGNVDISNIITWAFFIFILLTFYVLSKSSVVRNYLGIPPK